ncbi:thymidylate kinase [Candidatus Parcubacteria bacterium]|nr:thymidylate kinase [Candidatus Parcubacteria bacterium]
MRKNKFKGRLIVIDGIDGAGKATQTKILIRHLKKLKHKTATLDFPQYYNNFFGKMTGRFLNGEFGDAPNTNPYLASVLYAADRWETKNKIEKWLREGKIVILDRYSSSNQIHQGGKISDPKKRKQFLDWLEEMEFNVFKIPKPDLIIFLNVPYKISKKLLTKKVSRNYIKSAKNDKVEKSRIYQESSYLQSLNLVKKYNNWTEINCVKNNELLSPEKISTLVWAKLEKFLKK